MTTYGKEVTVDILYPGIQGINLVDMKVTGFNLEDQLTPAGTYPLVNGEWLEICGTEGGYVKRKSENTVDDPETAKMSVMVFAENGRTDIQVWKKVPVILASKFVGKTLVYNASAAPAIGAQLEVAGVPHYDGGGTYVRGLRTVTTGLPVAYCIGYDGDYLIFQTV